MQPVISLVTFCLAKALNIYLSIQKLNTDSLVLSQIEREILSRHGAAIRLCDISAKVETEKIRLKT